MSANETKSTSGGKLPNVVNPPGDSDRVKAPVVAGSLSDSEEGTIGKHCYHYSCLEKAIRRNNNNSKFPENYNNIRRSSVSSNASSVSGLSTSSHKRKRTLLDVGDPGPELTLYSKAEDELLEILHIFDLRAKKKSYAERLDEVPEKLHKIRRALLGLTLENANLRGRLAAMENDSLGRPLKEPSYAEATKRVKSRSKDSMAQEPKKPPPTPKANNQVKASKVFKNRHVLRITAQDAEIPLEELQKKLRDAVNPSKEKIHIRNCRPTKSGAIMIETNTVDDMTRLMSSTKISEAGLRVQKASGLATQDDNI
ncbi:unnamed protein product [Trichogramma brassicae]|uniref:Uncharacterized protein n=1 Tax=Trichogramma brassicae TaxID=86971 RepID=A0A6H5J474_9HYME|nr:unnamed protein product [Trichogramma brassicae]